jgi:hypothetical protein
MKSIFRQLTCLPLVLVPLAVDAQTPVNLLSTQPVEWAQARWSGAAPTADSVVVISNARTLKIEQGQRAITTLRVGNNDQGGTVQMTGGELTASGNIQLGTAGAGRSQFMQRGGRVTANRIQLASSSSAEARAAFGIGGGRLAFSHLDVGKTGTAVFSVLGSAVEGVSGMNIFVGGGKNGALEFIMDAAGVTPVRLSGRLEIGASSHLRVDGSRFGGGAGRLVLVAGRTSGRFPPENVVLRGFSAELNPVVEYGREGLVLRLEAATGEAGTVE